MGKSSEVFNALYNESSELIPGNVIYVVSATTYGHQNSEVALSVRDHPHSNGHYEIATFSGTSAYAKSGVRAYTIGEYCGDRRELLKESVILLASTSSKNVVIGTVGHRSASYGENNTTFWLDCDFTERQYKAYKLIPVADFQGVTQKYELKNTKGTFMSNIKSPNGNRTVNGSQVASLADHQLLPLLATLHNINELVKNELVTKTTAVSLSSFNAKDLEDGEAVLLKEIKFRGERETLAEIARLEAQELELRTNEEKRMDLQTQLAALKATVSTDALEKVEEAKAAETVVVAAKRKR